MLFMGGFPRYDDADCIWAQQKAIYHVQINLEETQLRHFPGRILLCDRGTLDGVAYVDGKFLVVFVGVVLLLLILFCC